MHWIHLTEEDQIQNVIIRSQEKPQVIFKYSNRCFLSETIFHRLQKNCCPEKIDFYFLDLVAYRNISDKVSEVFHVHHQSPQILLIKDGECIFEESHSEISLEEIMEHTTVTI
jgi:bacillithiol system protein YtxJ